MYMTNNENQGYNEFMTKLFGKLSKLNSELQNDYNKLSPNAKISVDNTMNNIQGMIAQAQNMNEVINIINRFIR